MAELASGGEATERVEQIEMHDAANAAEKG